MNKLVNVIRRDPSGILFYVAPFVVLAVFWIVVVLASSGDGVKCYLVVTDHFALTHPPGSEEDDPAVSAIRLYPGTYICGTLKESKFR